MNQPRILTAALVTAGLFTLSTGAHAQDAPAGATVGSSSSSSAQLETVVVTAQKRLQASSKVPVSLSVVTDDDLRSKGVANAANLTELVPNMQIGVGSSNGMEITIRGIGNTDNSVGGDPQTAFHIDGIYVGRPQAAAAAFYDLARVEVLRGPQGTLYGRNANAGAINLVSKRPVNRFEGEAAVEIGDYNARRLDAVVNVPVSDAFALRAVVSSARHDGYSDTANASNSFTKDRDDRDNLSARVLGLLKFSPTASLLVGVDSSRDKGAGTAFFDVSKGVAPTSRTQTPEVQGSVDNLSGGVFAEAKAGLGGMDLTYLYGHRHSSRDEITSQGPSPSAWLTYGDDYAQDSHELRLASNNDSALQWLAGVYWFKEVAEDVDLTGFLPKAFGGSQLIRFHTEPYINRSRAVFGQATYELHPDLRVTLGLRTTRDEKSRRGNTLLGPTEIAAGAVGSTAEGAWSKLTYKLGLEYDLDAHRMAYVSLATGYKAGGFNDGNNVVGDAQYNPRLNYNPESIRSLEAGLKGTYFGNTLALGASVFHYAYDNLQKSAAVDNKLYTINAAKAQVSGAELEGRVAVGADGRVNFALGLLRARYKDYIAPNGTDLSDTSLDRAPKATLTLGYTHKWDIGAGRVTAYLGTRYSASYLLSDTGSLTAAPKSVTQDAGTKTDLTLTYAPLNDRWSIQAYGKNLENKVEMAAIFTSNGQNLVTLAEPRTVGLRANVKF